MASAPKLRYNRNFPPAPPPNDDIAAIGGNCTPKQKQANVNTLAHFVGEGGNHVFAYNDIKHLRLVEMNVFKRKLGSTAPDDGPEILEGQTIFEIEVKEGMLSRHGVLAGACVMHVMDITTFSTLLTLGLAIGRDTTGASTAMEVKWHSAALSGTMLRIISTTVNFKGRTVSCRSEAYDKKTGILIASAVHTVSPLASFQDTAVRRAKL